MDFENMKMKDIWNELNVKLNENREPLEGSDVTYAFELSGDDGGLYGLKITDGWAEMLYEGPSEFECQLKMNVKNFKKLLGGNFNATTGFMTGRLKVEGNIGYALKLESILKKYNF